VLAGFVVCVTAVMALPFLGAAAAGGAAVTGGGGATVVAQEATGTGSEAELVAAIADDVVAGGEAEALAHVSDAQVRQFVSCPSMQAMVRGTGWHNAIRDRLTGVAAYNASRGPDFFFGDCYVEFTTKAQFMAHWARYGGVYDGYPVFYVCH